MAAQELTTARSAENLVDQVPGLRQLLLLVGLAAAVALGVWVVLWSREDSYQVLFSNLADRDAVEIVQVLESAGVPYRYESGGGAVLVPSDQVHSARLQLASQDLPNSAGVGFEMLNQSNGLSDSQFVETARFQRALEVELQRTIASISAVSAARVHLAVPRQTVFVRDRAPAGASVLVNLYPGRRLEPAQVGSIINLIASSVPDMERSQVTVVDQNGNLLSPDPDAEDADGKKSIDEQAERMEVRLTQRVEELLASIVGMDNVRAQVAVSLNPEMREETQELYDPESPVVRSEQLSAEPADAMRGGRGVPGALSNQPPVAEPEVAGAENGDAADEEPMATRSLRNYEISRTVRYVQAPVGAIRRLNVAVVLNQRTVANAEGEPESVPYTEEEIERFSELVRKAVGFEEARGDAVTVVGTNFLYRDNPDEQELPEPSFLDDFDLLGALRVIAALVVIILLIFMIIRPTLRQLLAVPPRAQMLPPAFAQGLPAGAGAQGDASAEARAERETREAPKRGPAEEFEERVSNAKQIVNQDPKRVAQVVRDWVNEGE
ncbi:flagellar basal-body MS-ring/collar protein FliF [Chromatocurvus halotolerans]|uniref:Flagellar M-ring protein n=1 Tax=Chromatocurvus halotolerans TaxID=1132028 RepID=A0A4R2KUN3_9GAMM|nr:flagellar basal-body MS-ring/collar protein FliF [Chromatocurvus halotolerans]TCO76602.1 flagellar M-ring protein FliF [Chromatocurvus halotolerans]